MLKKTCFMFMFLVFLPGVSIAGEINFERLYKQEWINIETANFDLITNLKEKKALEIVQELENFKYFLAGSMGFEQRDLSEKVSVVAAKNKTTFTSLGMPDNTAGVFINHPEYIIFARCDWFKSSSQGGSNRGRSVVLHELVHLFMRNASLNFALPVWFSEGIAEYYSSYIEQKDKVLVGSMGVLENRLFDLRDVDGEFKRVDSESLFKITKAELNIKEGGSINDNKFARQFYARSVAVVHYMSSDPHLLQQMYAYLYLLKKEMAVDEAFSIAFKTTYSEFDDAVHKYVSKWTMTALSYRLGKGGVEFPVVEYRNNHIAKKDAMGFMYAKLSKISEGFLGEGEQKRLYAGMETYYPGQADMVTLKQLSEKPEDVPLLLSIAATYKNLGKYGEAIDLFEKAMLLDSSNPTILNGLSWLLVTASDETVRDPQRAIPLAEKAVSLRKSAALLDTLAEAYYGAGLFQRAIETIKEAIELNPDDDYLKEQLEKFEEAA